MIQYYLHYRLGDTVLMVRLLKSTRRNTVTATARTLLSGGIKADHYLDMESKQELIPDEWKRKSGIEGYPLDTHHLIDLNETGTGTWLIWSERILDMAFKNPDVVFIFRPHPL